LERNSTNFYRRRFIRLAPVYYACLAYSIFPLLIAPHGVLHTFPGIIYSPPSSPLLSSVAGALMGIPMLLTPIWVTFGVVWSLTCEIVYYAISVRLASATTAAVLSIAAVSFTCYVLMGQVHYPTLPEAVSIVCLWWIWLTGFLYRRHRNSAGAGVLLAAGAFLSIAINPAMPERLAPFCICGTVLALWRAPRISLSRRTAGLFIKLGDISYPLYLSHVTTYFLLYHWFPRWFPAHSFFYYPIAVLVAALIQTYIEQPIQRRFRGES
jgi:peptidoglycan/LPS O-acetylase OafA/YrhL